MKNFILSFTFILLSVSSLFAQKGLSVGINAGVNLSLSTLETGKCDNLPVQFRRRQLPGINQALYVEYGFNDRIGLRLSVRRANLIHSTIFDKVITDSTRVGPQGQFRSSSTSRHTTTHSPVHIDLALRQRYALNQKWYFTTGVAVGYMPIRSLGSGYSGGEIKDVNGNLLIAYSIGSTTHYKHTMTVNAMLGLEYMTKRGNAFTFDIGYNAGMSTVSSTPVKIFHRDANNDYNCDVKIRSKGDYFTWQLGYKFYILKNKQQ